jgi:hypothetical protein
MTSQQESRFDLPGFTLSLAYTKVCFEIAFPHMQCTDRISVENMAPMIFSPMPLIMKMKTRKKGKLKRGSISHAGLTDVSFLYTFRELLMMRVMNTITDKPDWERKV